MTRVYALSVALLAAACASPVSVESFPEGQDRKLQKLALLPFEDTASDETAGDLVTGKVLEALVQTGRFDVIPPTETALALKASAAPLDAKSVGSVLHAAFGCDAIVSGAVARYIERDGGPRGVVQPASVAFELEVRAPEGPVIWRGRYDETQEDVASNLGTIKRAWDRGFEWVTADALAAGGARELALELRRSAASWR